MTRDDIDDNGLATESGRHHEDGARGGGALLREIAIILVSALVLSWLIKTFLIQAFFIPSESMEDTLQVDDRVMVSRLVPGVFDVHRGDIVVFTDPGGWLPAQRSDPQTPIGSVLTWIGLRPQDTGDHLIKRTIGVAGDHVECCDAEGRVSVNGEPLDEPYLKPGSIPSEVEFDVTVPADSLFVMGDNRQHSGDSRYHLGDPGGGFVPLDDVTGSAFIRVWPFDRFAVLHNPGDVFADVPEP
ncbi:signal peptidase I [Paraoerskovia marina]|uniref:Signal peptidase I n=1 Tax=Paraoerskovia marina TaxID=545619 RepID=A0A1H1U1G2_9CELL|nr:signal peptidase I [Paraoerskovia marina]SDS66340.1 signal peptidase I [Paraoerskovia marina]